MPMMGRGSDTRMYSPRSESDKMYSSANEDEDKYSPSDPEYNEQKREEKKRKAEEKKAKRAKIKHIKIRATQGLSGEESPSPLDDGNKRDAEREIGLAGGPAGSRGTLLDLATGAKSGTGSAMSPGLPIAMSEPMKDAWSSLLKMSEAEAIDYFSPENQLERSRAKKRGATGHGRMKTGTIQNIREMAEQRGQRNVDLGIPPHLRFAHGSHPQMIQQRAMIPDVYTDRLPTTAEEKNQIADLTDVAQSAGMRPHTLYHRQAFSNLMLPPGPFGEQESSAETNPPPLNIVDSPIPGMAFVNGQLVPDPRIINTSEPMEDAWSTLLKKDPDHEHDFGDGSDEDVQQYFDEMVRPEVMNPNTPRPHAMMEHKRLQAKIDRMYQGLEDYDEDLLDEHNYRIVENDLRGQGSAVSTAGFDRSFQDIHTSEPMKDAWSSLLKRETPRTIAGRRRREARQQFRPSTGQFKTPPGGMSGGVGATMRRFKAQMRGIKSGKKTGLMKPHLSVEMSHRGIQTKQPLSKDPQKYTQYKGQSEARKILGNVRTPFSPHARYGARSNYAGPTGAGRIGGLMAGQRGQMARPALRRMRVRRPRMPRMRAPRPPTPPMMPQMQSSVPAMPASPSTIMMSEEQYRSELLKSRNTLRRIELLNLMRRLIQAKEREAKLKKAEGIKPNSGHLPAHPAGVEPSDDEDPDGPTENLETDAKTFGLDPVGIINSRRGHM